MAVTLPYVAVVMQKLSGLSRRYDRKKNLEEKYTCLTGGLEKGRGEGVGRRRRSEKWQLTWIGVSLGRSGTY